VKRSSWLTALTSSHWCWAWSAPEERVQYRLLDRQEVELVAGEDLVDGVVGRDRGERAVIALPVELHRGAEHVALVHAAVVHAHVEARVVHALGDVEVEGLGVGLRRREAEVGGEIVGHVPDQARPAGEVLERSASSSR